MKTTAAQRIMLLGFGTAFASVVAYWMARSLSGPTATAPVAKTPAQPSGPPAIPVPSDWRRRVIAYVSSSEGAPDAVNRNTDGQGLSYGIIQWTQRSGQLYNVLDAMNKADPVTFRRIFVYPDDLLAHAKSATLANLGGEPLWGPNWVRRFQAAGKHPAFIDAQWNLAAQGPDFQRAEEMASIIGVRTPRAMTLYFDRAVQQGRYAKSMAVDFAAALPASIRGQDKAIVSLFGAKAINHFRRFGPTSPNPEDSGWTQVAPNEWRLVRRGIDLFDVVNRRVGKILNDTTLSDEPIPVDSTRTNSGNSPG